MNYKKIAEKYMNDALSGKVVVCNYVKLAIKRHRKDLRRKDIYFDENAANRFLKFSALCRYTKGTLASKNKKIEFTPQQVFRYWILMGWKKLDGSRRFRKVYFEVARKNGKSEEAAILSAYFLLFDNEFGAEVYTAATTYKQAKIVFDSAKEIIRKLALDSNKVSKLVNIGKFNVSVLETNSKMEPISSNDDKQDGLNPNFAVVDEYHAHKDSDLLEVIQSGMGSREQPMLFIITTAGFEKQYPCYREERKIAVEVLKCIKKDDSLFSVIFTIDKDDDWKDEKVWIKSNPNIGITPTWDFMRQQFRQAINQGVTKEVQFKTKNLNIWTDSSIAWIRDEDWQKCGVKDLPDLTGRVCYGGLDLAAKTDMNAFVLYFPPLEDEKEAYILPFFWLPKETIDRKENAENYRQWVRDGHLKIAGEYSTDVRLIAKDISDLHRKYNIKSFAYDSWGAIAILHLLADEGIEGVEMRQGFRSMSEPTKNLEALILAKKIKHDNNPILRWQCSNVELSIDPAENIKIDKKKSADKVDGMVALVNALACFNAFLGIEEEKNVYEERGLREL